MRASSLVWTNTPRSLFPKNYSLAQVRMPKGQYSGQKLIRLVRKKMPPKASKIMASVPVITLVRYNTAIATAINIRMILSALPMFFFIVSIVKV